MKLFGFILLVIGGTVLSAFGAIGTIGLANLPIDAALGPYTLWLTHPNARAVALAGAGEAAGGDAAGAEWNPASLSAMGEADVWGGIMYNHPIYSFSENVHTSDFIISSAGSAGKIGNFYASFWYHRAFSANLDVSHLPTILDTLNLPSNLRTQAALNLFGLDLAFQPLPALTFGIGGELGYYTENGLLPIILAPNYDKLASVTYQRSGYGVSGRAGVMVMPAGLVRVGLSAGTQLPLKLNETWYRSDAYGSPAGNYGSNGQVSFPPFVSFGLEIGPVAGWALDGGLRYDVHSQFRNSSSAEDFFSFYNRTNDELVGSVALQSGVLFEALVAEVGYAYVQPVNEDHMILNSAIRNRFGVGVEASLGGVHLGLGVGYERARTQFQLFQRAEVVLSARWGK